MAEMDTQNSGEGIEKKWTSELEEMLKNAKTDENLDAIGQKINYAIDNNLNVDVYGYQLKVSKKMTEIYKNLKDEVKI